MNRKVLGMIGSVVLAAAGTFVLVSYVQGAEERAAAGEQTVEVLVVDEAVAAGEPANAIANNLRTALVPQKIVPEDAVADLEALGDQVAAIDLVPGEQLLATRFITEEELAAQAEIEIPPGTVQVTVSLSPDRAVGGLVRPGDQVAFFASFEPFDFAVPDDGSETPVEVEVDGQSFLVLPGTQFKTPNTTHLTLHKLVVTNVQIERLPTTADEGTTPQGVELAPTGNLLVTIAVPVAEAEKVVFTVEHGTAWLGLEQPEGPESGTRIETRGTIYE